MGHHIRGYISTKQNLLKSAEECHQAIVVDLNHSMGLLPLTHALADEINERFHVPPTDSVSNHESSMLSAAEVHFGQHISQGGPTAYVETDYHGGTGTQHAIAWNNGVPICGPLMTSNELPSQKDASVEAINAALKSLGISAVKYQDEFDSIRLQYYRYPDEFEPPDGKYLDPTYFHTCLIKYPRIHPPKNRLKQLFEFLFRGR